MTTSRLPSQAGNDGADRVVATVASAFRLVDGQLHELDFGLVGIGNHGVEVYPFVEVAAKSGGGFRGGGEVQDEQVQIVSERISNRLN